MSLREMARRVLGKYFPQITSPTVTVTAFAPVATGTHTLTVDAPTKPLGSTFIFTGHVVLDPAVAPYYDWASVEIYRNGVIYYVATDYIAGMISFPRDGDLALDYNFDFTPAEPGDYSFYALAYTKEAA